MCTDRNETSICYTRFPESDREKRTREVKKEVGEMMKEQGERKGKLPVLR